MPFDALPVGDVIYAEPHDFPRIHPGHRVLQFFGPNGEMWTQGTRHDRVTGKRCLAGALDVVFPDVGPVWGRCSQELSALLQPRGMNIVGFNDSRSRKYSQVRELILLWIETHGGDYAV